MVCSLLTIVCRLHSAGIRIRCVNSPIGNAGLNSGVDSGITGVDALHAGCIAGRRRSEKYAVNYLANSRRIFQGVFFYF
jgi:hypothetical protein